VEISVLKKIKKDLVNFGTEILIRFGKISNFSDFLKLYFACKRYLRNTLRTEAPQVVKVFAL